MALTKITTNVIKDAAVTRPKVGYPGAVLQVVNSTYRDAITYTSTTLNTWPLSVTVTPLFSNSKIFIMFDGWVQPLGELYAQVYLYKNGSNLSSVSNVGTTGSSQGSFAGGVVGLSIGSNNQINQGRNISFNVMDTAGTTSAITYDIRCQAGNGTYSSYSLGRNNSAWSQAGVLNLTVMEIAG
jgi:hypothetical protein